MLTLIDGQQGAGKTTFAVAKALEIQKKEPHREVWQHGIDSCSVEGWHVLEDPTQWYTLPVGAIIIIDEAAAAFPNGRATSRDKLPEYLTAVERLRHQGHDLFLICPNAKSLHYYLRQNSGEYFNLEQPFGLGYCICRRYAKYPDKSDPNYFHLMKGVVKTQIKHDRNAQALFKSTELVTGSYKPRAPVWKIAGVFLLLLAGISGMVYGFVTITAPTQKPAAEKPKTEPAKPADKPAPQPPTQAPSLAQALTPPAPPSQAAQPESIFAGAAGCGATRFGKSKRCTCRDESGMVIPMGYNECVARLKGVVLNAAR